MITSPLDQVRHELPYIILLPEYEEKRELYRFGVNHNHYLEISDNIYQWLEDIIGFGTESAYPFSKIIERASWIIVKLRQESMIEEEKKLIKNKKTDACNIIFFIRFRNEEDAILFRTTWI